ncbi:MAG: VanZ family protein [Subdoligranulum sp.]
MPEQNNKLKLVRAVMLCVTLAIMAAIFLFSAQPGESSSALSQQITEKVESTAAHRLTPKWFSSQNDNANIRKWAHVYIYCALGVSTAVTVHLFGSAGKAGGAKQLVQEALISAVTCTAYAGTDEFHQLFIPGRAGMIQDVGVDALGFFCPALPSLFWSLPGCGTKRPKHNNKNNNTTCRGRESSIALLSHTPGGWCCLWSVLGFI